MAHKLFGHKGWPTPLAFLLIIPYMLHSYGYYQGGLMSAFKSYPPVIWQSDIIRYFPVLFPMADPTTVYSLHKMSTGGLDLLLSTIDLVDDREERFSFNVSGMYLVSWDTGYFNDGDSIPPSDGGRLAGLPYKLHARVSIVNFAKRGRLPREGSVRSILPSRRLHRYEAWHGGTELQTQNLKMTSLAGVLRDFPWMLGLVSFLTATLVTVRCHELFPLLFHEYSNEISP